MESKPESFVSATQKAQLPSVSLAVASEKWDKLVERQESSKFYHLSRWGTLLQETHGHRLFYVEGPGGQFPLALIRSRIFGDRLISLPFADYGGPLAMDEAGAVSLLSRAEDIARELGVDFLEIRSPLANCYKTLHQRGYVRRDDYFTFVLPLGQNLDALWKGIGDKNRNMVRKAQRSQVEIRWAQSRADLKTFYSLYSKTMKKLGSPPQPFKFYDRMWDLFYPQNLLLPLAIHQGRCIAGGIFFLHKKTIHHSYGCSLPEYLELAPNNLVQWHVIEWGNREGYSSLDFGRTRENAGNLLFKRRWGGTQTPMPYFYKFYKKEIKERQEMEFHWLSRIWSRFLPEFAANRIGPRIVGQIG